MKATFWTKQSHFLKSYPNFFFFFIFGDPEDSHGNIHVPWLNYPGDWTEDIEETHGTL